MNFVFAVKIFYHNLMFDLLEMYYDALFFVMCMLELGKNFMILVCLLCKKLCSFIAYVIFIYLSTIVDVGYNLFLDWIIVTYRYVFELFYKSVFFDFYIAFCATYVALCEAKAELHRESLTADLFWKQK